MGLLDYLWGDTEEQKEARLTAYYRDNDDDDDNDNQVGGDPVQDEGPSLHRRALPRPLPPRPGRLGRRGRGGLHGRRARAAALPHRQVSRNRSFTK